MDNLETKDNAGDAERPKLVAGISVETATPEPVTPVAALLLQGALGVQKTLLPVAPSRGAAEETLLASPKIFAADLPTGTDALGVATLMQPLAELAAHRDTEAPLTIGLLGAPGVGKSFALGRLLSTVNGLSELAKHQAQQPFLSALISFTIDVLGIAEAPALGVATKLHDRLAELFPALAQEAAQAVRHPLAVAREAAEDLDATRRRLDAERQNLAEIEARRACLTDTLLFEQAGSQVNVYARAHRGKIDSRLRGFGFTGEPLQNYKSLVRDIAEPGGFLRRIGVVLHALWAFKGQARLLVTALCLYLVSVGGDFAIVHQSDWLGWLRHLGTDEAFVPMADWLAAHIGWLDVLKQAAFAVAGLAVAVDIFRAWRFLQPLFRGAGLLSAEVAHRRRDLDQLYAHQMQRVDALAADAELHGQRVAVADRRAARAAQTRLVHRVEASPFAEPGGKIQAERFFAAVSAAIQRGSGSGMAVPQRIVIGFDNIDRLPQPQAAEVIDTIARSLAQPGFISVIAADPQRLAYRAHSGSLPTGDRPLSSWLDIPIRIGTGLAAADYTALVAQALGHGETAPAQALPGKPLDWTVSAAEARLMTALMAKAAASPRAVKRFVNLYRLARAGAGQERVLLAFMLTVDQCGSAEDRAAVAQALATIGEEAAFAVPQASDFLAAALDLTYREQGRATVAAARQAYALAQAFSLRM